MTKDADQIREEIRATREDLSANVNTLTESVRPGNVARRQVDKVRGAAVNAKDRVMGSAPDLASARGSAVSTAGDARDSVRDVASSASDAVASSPQVVRSKTQGNPLAAGLIAFGAGWLIGSLIPTSEREQQAALKAKESATPLAHEAAGAARQSAENLREPAQQAVRSVRQSATEAVENTKQEGTSSAERVRSDVQGAAGTVREGRTG
jgi:gas vesicle protein